MLHLPQVWWHHWYSILKSVTAAEKLGGQYARSPLGKVNY